MVKFSPCVFSAYKNNNGYIKTSFTSSNNDDNDGVYSAEYELLLLLLVFCVMRASSIQVVKVCANTFPRENLQKYTMSIVCNLWTEMACCKIPFSTLNQLNYWFNLTCISTQDRISGPCYWCKNRLFTSNIKIKVITEIQVGETKNHSCEGWARKVN